MPDVRVDFRVKLHLASLLLSCLVGCNHPYSLETFLRLEDLGLVAFAKTTGGKGLHVVTPFAAGKSIGWKEAKAIAREIGARMAADSPDKYLVNMSKAKRTGKIFLDYLRNDRMATAVALLSPRARDGATVSMPLT